MWASRKIFYERLSVFPRLSFSKTRRTPNCGPSGERFAMMRGRIPRNRAELTTKSEPFEIRISHPGREIQFSCENLLLALDPQDIRHSPRPIVAKGFMVSA